MSSEYYITYMMKSPGGAFSGLNFLSCFKYGSILLALWEELVGVEFWAPISHHLFSRLI